MEKKTMILVAVAIVVVIAAAAAVVVMQGNNDKPVTVTYDGNGGKTYGTGEPQFTTTSNKTLSSTFFVRDGYVMTEWNTKADGTGKSFGFDVSTNGETKFYAIWVESSYFTYNSDGGTEFSRPKIPMSLNHNGITEAINYGSLYLLNNNEGKIIVNVASTYVTNHMDGEKAVVGVRYDDSGTDRAVTFMLSNIKWVSIATKENSVEISFKTNGNKCEMSTWMIVNATNKVMAIGNGGDNAFSVFFAYDLNIEIGNLFEREGYKFVKWNTKADGTGTSYPEASTFTAPITIFAIWEKI